MVKNQSGAYYGLLGLSLAFSILAAVTLLPNPGASKPNVLGYRSVCSFAPAASALCGLLAAATCTVRNRLVSRNAASARYQPLFAPVAAALLLLSAAAVFGIRFGVAQAGFGKVIAKTDAPGSSFASLSDGTRSATASDGDISATVELTATRGRVEKLALTGGRNVEQSLAEKIFEEVLAAQSSRVDAVSGATASSRVLLKAVEAAAAAP
jgi:uncharacterized protein with FMN-binding domain